jgi:hypothetical protein
MEGSAMAEPRLMAIVTALFLMAGTLPARAAYDIDQLRQIEQFLLQKDYGSLLLYLEVNPAIMSGTDALATELRVFVATMARRQLDFFAARLPAPPVLPTSPLLAFSGNRIEPY